MKKSRRRFLSAATATSIVGVAGCTGLLESSEDEPEPTATTTARQTVRESTETRQQPPEPDVTAKITRVFDYPDREDDRKVAIEVMNNTDERLPAAMLLYQNRGGLVFDIPPNGFRETEVHYRDPSENDDVTIADKWTWFPNDYPRELVDGEVTANPARLVEGEWRYPVENPTNTAIDEIEDIAASGTHPFTHSRSMGGSVIDGQLLLTHSNLGPFWEYDWSVKLSGITSQEEFSMATPPAEMSIEDVQFTAEETDSGTDPYHIPAVDISLTAESEQPLFDAVLRFYSTQDSIAGSYCWEDHEISRGWREEDAFAADSFLGEMRVSDGKTPVLDISGSGRVGQTTTVTYENGVEGTAECLNPVNKLISFDVPIDEEERIAVVLMSGFSVIDYATSEPVASKLS